MCHGHCLGADYPQSRAKRIGNEKEPSAGNCCSTRYFIKYLHFKHLFFFCKNAVVMKIVCKFWLNNLVVMMTLNRIIFAVIKK